MLSGRHGSMVASLCSQLGTHARKSMSDVWSVGHPTGKNLAAIKE
jgi:hypothetical protein